LRLEWIVLAGCGITALYHLTAIAACLLHLRKRMPRIGPMQPVSILKPVRGLDPHFAEAIESHARQDYAPGFELLFGVPDAQDAALPAIQRLAARDARVLPYICETARPNAKAGVLEDLARQARYPLLLVNDADIRVPPGYLERVTAPLADPDVGIVTCLYRAFGDSWPARWEAFGIAVDFAPSVLVAPLVGVREFGLGATLVFRRADLDAIGGFAALGDYLADDYQLARRIVRELGKRAVMSGVVVDTFLGDDSWERVWKHQVRWARTIRVSRGDGYLGLPVTHAGLWILLALACGWHGAALGLAAIRVTSGVLAGWGVLGSSYALWAAPLIPLWDLWAFVVWIAGIAGRTVEWRGQRLELRRDGRLVT
jgi:ceramide glucosyltransferase